MRNNKNIPITIRMNGNALHTGKSRCIWKYIDKLIIVCLLLFTTHLSAQIQVVETNENKLIAEKNEFIQNADTLPYRFIYPENQKITEKYPLLIYLHGGGINGTDNEKPLRGFLPYIVDTITGKNKFPCFILVPQCAKNDVWVSFPGFPNSLTTTNEATPSSSLVLLLIHRLIENQNIDPCRIYLTGFSMGGEGTFDLLAREPNLFACAVPVASVADTSKAAIIKNIPIWAFHGNADQVNDVKYTRLIIEAVTKQGGHPRYTELNNVGHDCRKYAYNNEELWKWVFEQHLRPRTGCEIYDSLFGNRQTDCVHVLNYQDQKGSQPIHSIWLYFETCSQELERILSKYTFESEKISTERSDWKIPGGESLNWFNPATLGDSIMVYELSINDSKDILTIWSNIDKTKVFVRNLHQK